MSLHKVVKIVIFGHQVGEKFNVAYSIPFCKIIQLCIVCTVETTAQRLTFESSGDFEETITYVSFKVAHLAQYFIP